MVTYTCSACFKLPTGIWLKVLITGNVKVIQYRYNNINMYLKVPLVNINMTKVR